MIESGIEVIDAILSNPIQSMIIFGGMYLVYRIRNPDSRKHLRYDWYEFKDLWSIQFFPARDEYDCPEYYLIKQQEALQTFSSVRKLEN